MFTPKRPSVLSTPGSSRVTRSQSLKTSNEFFNSSMSGGGVTPHNRISLTMSSIYNDAILESYKAPLPIKIKELIFNLKSQDFFQLNATILSNGHICLVNERKLYIWKLKKTFKNIQCSELSLPFSRTLIKQNCVSVECHNNKDYVGLCVTVEGLIRYWPSIFNEYQCIDEKLDLPQNDEIVHLLYITENLYLIFSANGSFFSVNIDNQEGKNVIITKKIDLSSSLLSSVGRRMTSLIFGGGGQSLNKNTQNFKSAVRYKSSSEIFALVEKNLQKLKINNDNTFSILSQVNIEKLYYEEYISQNVNSLRITINFQDCAITKNSIYILAIVEDDGPKFVIAEIDTSNRVNDLKIKSYHVLNYKLSSSNNYQYKFFAMDSHHAFYIYNQNSIISFTGPTLEFNGESKFNTLGDRIIASNFCDSDLIFFSLNHEILKVKDNSLRLSIDEESFSLGRVDQNQSIDTSQSQFNGNLFKQNISNYNFSDLNSSVQSLGEDTSFYKGSHRQSFDFTFSNLGSSEQICLNKLKEAFQSYLKKEERDSQLLIEDLLRNDLVEKKIDFVCVELSEKLIDDIPAHDPRWAELNKTKSLNTNLIISNQLKGKIRLHEYFIAFLKKFDLWDKLTQVGYNGRDIKTKYAIMEHAEKLQLALSIREQLYSKNQEFINLAIEYTTKNREDLNSKLIYPHDVFYRRVSKIDEIFNSLFSIENEVIRNNSSEQAISYLIDTTYFFTKLLKTSQSYREEKRKIFDNHAEMEDSLEFVRWTFLPINEITSSVSSIINLCIKQHKLCSEYGLFNCNTLENKTEILQNLLELDTLIFDEYECRLNSIEEEADYLSLKQTYDSVKTKLIEVYLKNKQIDDAIKLAEKYIDFNTLTSICEMKNDTDLLASYLDKFSNSSFADYVVRHFIEKRKLNFLLKNKFIKRQDISKCLERYQYLSWIKDFKNENYFQAFQTLRELGLNETDSFMKQKSLISLSKLSLIVNNSSIEDIQILNRYLEYLGYIEKIAQHISNMNGMSIEHIPAYKPEKLIEIYLQIEGISEVEFKKAFELIDYLNDDTSTFYSESQIQQIKVEILVRSILVDNWEEMYDMNYPETYLNQTKFFKTLYLLKLGGENVGQLIRLVEMILNHELLEHLNRNKKFAYLLQACFEMLP